MEIESDPDASLSSSPPNRFHRRPGISPTVEQLLELVDSGDADSRIVGAREIRRLTKTSLRFRRHLAAAIRPLVTMLYSPSYCCNESALLALLNLAVKDEPNKISIVDAGALEPIIKFLGSESANLQEYAAAALLTLSASAANKPIITSYGAIPRLVEIVRDGSPQAKADAVMALYNLSTYSNNIGITLKADPISPLVNMLKTCKRSSKMAEKCSALLEALVGFEEGRTALIAEEGGVLAVVEMLENGSFLSREHAVGTLLTLCQSDRCKYREPILREGVIPGLLELTVQGTPTSQSKAQLLLQLLRDSPYRRSEFPADTLENIVSNIISHIDGDDQSKKAKKMLAEMVQVSMEQSLRHLQQRALVYTPSDLPIASCGSKLSLKQ